MNIRPTTIHKANISATKIAVYDTQQKKAVLLFKSIHLCVDYLFAHRMLIKNEKGKFYNLIKKCHERKIKEDQNIFSLPLTYRYIMDGQPFADRLNGNDYVILDDKFVNPEYERKVKVFNRLDSVNDYSNEQTLKVGDSVELLYGTLKGYTTTILEIKEKTIRHTGGTKYYTLKVKGKMHEFKANVLSLVHSGD